MHIIKFVFVVLLITSSAYAQEVNWQQQYLNAKDFYNNKKYTLAMEAFKPLTEEASGNSFAAYSSFYYALSAYENGYLPLAKNMFLQIKNKFPKWNKMDDVRYWLGIIYFETGLYNQALNELKGIDTRAMITDVKALKSNYFQQIKDLDELKELYSNNDEDELLAYLLANRIAQETLVNQDQKLLLEIINKFDLPPSAFNVVEVTKSIKKDKYKVAVMLPFMVEELEPNLRRKVNQFVLEMYQGILLAAGTLASQGINLEVIAYDTKRSVKETKKILSKDEMKGMDLIIGPLYAGPIAEVNEFSFKNKINMMSPLTSNSETIGNNPYAFLFSPSNETVGRASSEYAAKFARNKVGIILYEDNPNDSAVAMAYKRRIEMDSFNIIINKKISKDNSREVLDVLLIPDVNIKEAAAEDAKQSFNIQLDSIGHIFVASNNDLISSKVLSAVETRGDNIMVIGSAEWLDLSLIKFDTYFKLGCALYAPNYSVNNTKAFSAFRYNYIMKHREIPSKYAVIGYELTYIMGKCLTEYGKYVQLGWRKDGRIDGHLTAGFNYQNSNDNLILPILEFEKDQITLYFNESSKK